MSFCSDRGTRSIKIGIDFRGILDEEVDLKRQEKSSGIALLITCLGKISLKFEDIRSIETLGIRQNSKSDQFFFTTTAIETLDEMTFTRIFVLFFLLFL